MVLVKKCYKKGKKDISSLKKVFCELKFCRQGLKPAFYASFNDLINDVAPSSSYSTSSFYLWLKGSRLATDHSRQSQQVVVVAGGVICRQQESLEGQEGLPQRRAPRAGGQACPHVTHKVRLITFNFNNKVNRVGSPQGTCLSALNMQIVLKLYYSIFFSLDYFRLGLNASKTLSVFGAP